MGSASIPLISGVVRDEALTTKPPTAETTDTDGAKMPSARVSAEAKSVTAIITGFIQSFVG